MPTASTNCIYCGKKRPLWTVMTEDDQIVFACAGCIELRKVVDD